MAAQNGQEGSISLRSRLDRQQKYIDSTLSFVLHPSIRQSLPQSGHKIRGAWVSETVPPTEKESALSISWMHLQPHEIAISSGLDPELVEHFDVVAVNLLHTSVESVHWDATIQNLLDLLQPGGWIQWVDWDPITARIAASKPGTADASNLRDLLRSYTDALQARKVGSTYRISNALKKQGLTEADSDMYPIAPDVGLTRVVADGALDYLKRTGHLSPGEAKGIEAKIEHDIQASGPLIWYDLWCHIAQKPSEF